MATEKELRHKVVNIMKGWLGWSEVNGKFKAIIDLYNTQKPLPVGYKMKYTDEWCAATVTAAGMQAGLSDIILGECSCSRMIALYKAKGRWMEDDAYRPDIGDILMYCWKDGANYATTDQTANPNHVGFVGAVNSNTMTISGLTKCVSGVKKCGFTKVVVMRRLNASYTWSPYKTYKDLYRDGTTYSLSKKLVVNPGWYYYVEGVHYAKKNALSTQKITSETGVKKV